MSGPVRWGHKSREGQSWVQIPCPVYSFDYIVLRPATEEAFTSDSVPRDVSPALESFAVSEGGGCGPRLPRPLQASTLNPCNPGSQSSRSHLSGPDSEKGCVCPASHSLVLEPLEPSAAGMSQVWPSAQCCIYGTASGNNIQAPDRASFVPCSPASLWPAPAGPEH